MFDLFSSPEFYKIGPIAVALLSLLISLLTYYDQHRSNRRLLVLEAKKEQLVSNRENSAQLTASIQKENGDFGASYFLEISNLGQAPAQQIDMKLDSLLATELEYIHDPIMTELGENSSKRFRLFLNPGQSIPSHIELTWNDRTGRKKQYKSSI